MFINGVSPGRYNIWDGIRGVDYLLTRKEVDPDRIGILVVRVAEHKLHILPHSMKE